MRGVKQAYPARVTMPNLVSKTYITGSTTILAKYFCHKIPTRDLFAVVKITLLRVRLIGFYGYNIIMYMHVHTQIFRNCVKMFQQLLNDEANSDISITSEK